MHDERFGHDVAQEAHAGNDDAECRRLRHNVEEFHLEHVSGLCAFDENRSGQRMHQTSIKMRQIGSTRVGPHLSVDGVARFQHHLFAFGHFQDRHNIGVIAIVPSARLRGETLLPVDAYNMHARLP
jgi:hypothetical protein